MIKQDFLFWNKAALSYMHQKTKEEWILLGDANTKLFHSSLRRQQYHNRIYRLTDGTGTDITNYDQVLNHLSEYYIHLLQEATQT